MKKYLGFDYNEAGELVEAYAYTITPAQKEVIEDTLCYYSHHTVEAIAEKYPDFITEDFKKILETLENIIKEEA